MKRLDIEDGSGKVMLIRWTLFDKKFISVKFHKFIKSDIDCMHDHPWSFISIMVWGSYLEETDNGLSFKGAPCIMFRKATHKHRVLFHKPCYTVVITFKRVREWGFWTKEGWVKWWRYMPDKSKRC